MSEPLPAPDAEVAQKAFEIAKEVKGKHRLENTWVIWYDSAKLQARDPDNWFKNLQTVAIFNTVEDFWSTYSHIKRPTDLEFTSNYHFFKQGIKPMWEDEANKEGGKWVINLSVEKNRVDEVWELLLLALIGEYLDESEEGNFICGAVMSKRKAGNRIAVWTRIGNDDTALMHIGRCLRNVLKLNDKTDMVFQLHSDSAAGQYTQTTRLRCTAE
jgi:translation initiation factor 4E